MADVEAFCIFCEDVREEPGEKQSWLGVLGGSLFTAPGTDKIEDISAVCIARISNLTEVEVTIDIEVESSDGTALTPGQYRATYSQRKSDRSKHWVLNLRLDMGGMPVEDGSIASVRFQVNDVVSSAFLPISWGEPKSPPEPVVVRTNDATAYVSTPTTAKKARASKAKRKQ